MFGIGIPELILILIVGLIVFGPNKLPEVGRAVGKGLREFKKASNALQATLNAPENEPEPNSTVTVEGAITEKKGIAPPVAPPAYKPPTQDSVREQLAAQPVVLDKKSETQNTQSV